MDTIRKQQALQRFERACTRLSALTAEHITAQAQAAATSREREIALREFRDATVVYAGIAIELGVKNIAIGGPAKVPATVGA